MYNLTQSFINEMVRNDIKYDYVPAAEGKTFERVKVVFKGENIDRLEINFFFDGSPSVNIKSYSIAKTPADKLPAMYKKLNDLNSEYRWLSFYLDDDNEVTASSDAVISESTSGEVCMVYLKKFINIVDDVYPALMKTLWA